MKLTKLIYAFEIFTIFLMLCAKVNAQNIIGDANIDKYMHFTGSYILTDIAKEKLNWSTKDTFFAITYVGIAKELYDIGQGGEFDIMDIIANYCGFGFRIIL